MPFIEQLPFNPSDPKNTTELCSLVAKACDIDVAHQFCWQASRFNPLYDNETVDVTDTFMFDKALRLAVCVVAALLALNTTDK